MTDFASVAARLRGRLPGPDQAVTLAGLLALPVADAGRILQGRRGLAAGEAAALCDALDVCLDWLLFGYEDEPVRGAEGHEDVVAFCESILADHLHLQAIFSR